MNFRDFGWEQMGTAERLAGFYSVTNTYLSIFLALGALALILGTIGLAVVLARSILERKSEIALLMAIGFSRNKVFKLIAREYLILLIAGVLIGLITSVTATLPSFISTYTGVSIGSIVIIIGIIFLNGLIWITVLTRISLNKKNIILALKAE
jgi:ABC-type antimicrobial peptide transport system permease subunit